MLLRSLAGGAVAPAPAELSSTGNRDQENSESKCDVSVQALNVENHLNFPVLVQDSDVARLSFVTCRSGRHAGGLAISCLANANTVILLLTGNRKDADGEPVVRSLPK